MVQCGLNPMATPRKYFHDHVVLLLLSIEVFLALLTTVLVLLRLTSEHGNGYIIQYRSSLGINAFKTGSIAEILSFIVFAYAVLLIHISLSLRTYHIQRQLSIAILALGILLLVLTIIVSNALLVLR
jgi:hypothetical protein